MFFYFDPLYLWIFGITLLISIGAQLYIKTAFSKWGKQPNSSRLTGAQVGQKIIQTTSLKPVKFEHTAGQLTDHYDPRHQIVRMSDSTEKEASVAAMAVIAHELGHVQQHQQGSTLIKMRNFLVPAVTFSPQISYALIMFGLIFQITGLAYAGIALFGLMVLFSVITLPVEFDASRRGLILLEQAGLMQTDADKTGSRAVLRAAGSTYLAAAITALLQLLYYLSLVNRNR